MDLHQLTKWSLICAAILVVVGFLLGDAAWGLSAAAILLAMYAVSVLVSTWRRK
ncbi:hypothetical protein ACUY3K_10080 [Corynebacterium uberis]|uniref:hypothetical protein n=1 Tax=Corynebacterium TaxID=1716 RepID=UPI001D0BA68B|nr:MULTISPECIES: hypothetical protein [Corynebacterium]MCZ9309420.1 hypothetical protein [Corynebacterium sp. c6VSa_13]UDL72969.1 hypothetical protein LH391_07555 [Corynebacterium uberis]UDL76154.1 hypothetical protein LH393_01835 [Corynebacterium uberis]UDL78366.1 hypothetical protein LH394_01830 [Corynebacterium uberis]UDL80649.1 hypothetical protein LH392_02260 [Corynebacterium uberis]